MAQQISPFLESKYGWNFGESGWNSGIDENQLKFSFLFDGNVDAVVGSLPPAVNGNAYFLTTDNRFYFVVGSRYYSSPCPKHFIFKIESSGAFYQFNGTSAVIIDNPTQLDSRLDSVELTISSLGTAAFEDTSSFATQAGIDVLESQMTSYTDTKASNIVVNIKDFGAVGDGVVDDAPALRAAMAVLVAKGGGKLYIPAGTYYLNSGDPRGLSLVPMTGVNDTYTVCEVADGVTVFGDGDATVIKYESNRVGEFLSADGLGVYRGDVGALFANFRVRENTNTPYAVSSFHVRDFKVLYTPLLNQTKDYIDGQVVRIYSNGGAVSNGEFTVHNINVSNNPGHQIFSYEKTTSFEGIGNRIYSPGFSSNPANSDHSCFYVSGARAVYRDNFCVGSVPDGNSTFIETICLYNYVLDNLCIGMNTFCNTDSQVVHPGPEFDNSIFVVSRNTARECRNFVVDYCYSLNRKSSLTIEGNNVLLFGDTASTTEALLKFGNDDGTPPANILPTATAIVRNNTVTVNYVAGEVVYETSFDALINHPHITHLIIEGNEVRGARRAVVNISSIGKHKSIRIANNHFLDVGLFGNSAIDSSGRASRCAVMCALAPGSVLAKLEVSGNRFVTSYAGGAPSYGVIVANYSGADAPTNFVIVDNYMSGANAYDILFDSQDLNTLAPNTVELSHTHSIFPSGDTFTGLVLAGATISAVRSGSSGRYRDVTARIVGSGASKAPKVEAHGSAAPATRYWFVGSVMHNTAPAPSGAMGWVCTEAGTPGTWKAFGNISA